MNQKKVRILITGAAGQIGYALLFRIASGQVFGMDTDIELHLLELERSLPMLEGVIMELDDCAFPLLKRIVYTADVKVAMDGVNWALLVGSVPRKAGMERSDLLQINGGIFSQQGQALNDRAASDVKIFVIGNPCNTNCYIVKNHAKDIPIDRFYAMTALDELRARSQLAKKSGVAVTAVSQMTIWGNHSATQYPDFYNAKINHRPVLETIPDEQWLQNDFVLTIQQRGASVLKARGASSAASAANAIIHGIKNLIYDTPLNESFSMCVAANGEYGVDNGLLFSFPCCVRNSTLQIVSGLQFNAFAQTRFNITLNELRQERDTVEELGLLRD